jgi:DNA (cytosine-5)-methyltransferase 1
VNALELFAGIGGISLGLERAGMTTVGHVEIDPYCCRVLAKHWPHVPQHDDARTAVDWWLAEPRPTVDLVAGGPPCQDISSAHTNGARLALDGPKSGLWSAYRDVVDALRSRWVLVENVGGDRGTWQRWVPGVRGQLWDLGYASVPLLVPAGGMGAPHPRPRVMVVAHVDREGQPLRAVHAQVAGVPAVSGRGSRDWREPFTGARRVDDGLPVRLDAARRRALGNAVVPQVAEAVARAIVAADALAVAA